MSWEHSKASKKVSTLVNTEDVAKWQGHKLVVFIVHSKTEVAVMC